MYVLVMPVSVYSNKKIFTVLRLERYLVLGSPSLGYSIRGYVHVDLYPHYALSYLGMEGLGSDICRSGPGMPFLGAFLV